MTVQPPEAVKHGHGATPIEGSSAPVPGGPTRTAPSPQHPAPPEPTPAPQSLRARALAQADARLPRGSNRRALARATLESYRDVRQLARQVRGHFALPGVLEPREPSYREWLREHLPGAAELQQQRTESAASSAPVTFRVCVLRGGDADDAAVRTSLRSLVNQSWTHWRATVCTGTQPEHGPRDPRIDVRVAQSVEAATDGVIRGADESFVILLPAGDELAPHALFELQHVVHQDPLVHVVTWDDDAPAGRSDRSPRFRPSWSPETLWGANYLDHCFAVRTRVLQQAGGVREGFGSATAWDVLLRLHPDTERTARVTKVLAHAAARRDRAGVDGVRAVGDALSRRGLAGRAVLEGSTVRIHWEPPAWPHVSVVIPTRHNREMLSRCLPALARTDYPAFDVHVIDNGGRNTDNDAWYERQAREFELDLTVTWWEETPFNYSRVNNVAAAKTIGEVLVFLNDDTEAVDPGWMRELVGMAVQPQVGCAGLQLTGQTGEIQFAGTVLGLGGFADHVFEGMRPHSDTLLGRTDWYRNALAITGACLAIRREVFDRLGGFDERFILCGSDVALGLDAHLSGLRNVCSPFSGIRHLESATRGTNVPVEDFFASYWKYNTWIFGGDPYFSPNLSLGSRRPALRSDHEPTPHARVSPAIGRNLTVFRQRNDEAESRMLADQCRVGPGDVEAVARLHRDNAGAFEVQTINWYIPDIDSPFYGGINTALRLADYLARVHGVENRFIVWGSPPDHFTRSAIAAAFPSLAECGIYFYDGGITEESLRSVPDSDVSIATLWVTAFAVAKAPRTRRKVYLVQDFEPMFYPASTLYALTEESYRLGLYGLCNTDNLRRIYEEDYGGRGFSFTPAVDRAVFHAEGRAPREVDDPVTVFVYARPGHWRNCWELASLALDELKDRLGDRVRIVTAGSWAEGTHRRGTLRPLGLLAYRATGDLYRGCDVGLALTVSKHPSYLPLELMACGVPVVAFDNPWGHWILRHEQNSLLAQRTVTGLVDALERLVVDTELRRRLSDQAVKDIAAAHGSWDRAFSGIYSFLCDPDGLG